LNDAWREPTSFDNEYEYISADFMSKFGISDIDKDLNNNPVDK